MHRASENSAGQSGHRESWEISFHALRHPATTLMKNAGIWAAIVRTSSGMKAPRSPPTSQKTNPSRVFGPARVLIVQGCP